MNSKSNITTEHKTRLWRSIKGVIVVTIMAIIALALYAHAAVITLENITGSQTTSLVVVATIIALVSIIYYYAVVYPTVKRCRDFIDSAISQAQRVRAYFNIIRNLFG